ncbi:MAG: helix-turn-helix domain-containing protein [Alicyclobacillus sp.]|nr:helix-turn-helix domain-containing protein [Alicyclobacillus sp.]
MPIGERIAAARRKAGWSQAQLAQRAGISASSIAMYETGRRQPDARIVAKLAAALGVPAAELAGAPAAAATTPAPAQPLVEDSTPAAVPTASLPPHHTPDRTPNPAIPLASAPAVDPPTATAVPAAMPQPAATDERTQLPLTREEARLIIFLRMHPQAREFILSYAAADDARRQQLHKAWRLIHQFQLP